MDIDRQTCFTYAYSTGTYADYYQLINTDEPSTNVLNLDAAGINIAGGSKPPWLIMVVGTVEDGTLATELEILLETDSAVGFGTTLRQIAKWDIPPARLRTAGNILINQPLGHFSFQQFMRLYFNAVTTIAALTVCAWLGTGPESAVNDFDLVNL